MKRFICLGFVLFQSIYCMGCFGILTGCSTDLESFINNDLNNETFICSLAQELKDERAGESAINQLRGMVVLAANTNPSEENTFPAIYLQSWLRTQFYDFAADILFDEQSPDLPFVVPMLEYPSIESGIGQDVPADIEIITECPVQLAKLNKLGTCLGFFCLESNKMHGRLGVCYRVDDPVIMILCLLCKNLSRGESSDIKTGVIRNLFSKISILGVYWDGLFPDEKRSLANTYKFNSNVFGGYWFRFKHGCDQFLRDILGT